MDSCSRAERGRIWWSGNQRTLPSELALREGPRRCWDTVAIVWPCLLGVDAYAAAGRGVKVPRPDCPGCGRPMGFWPGYLRWVRYGRTRRIWVRRATCRGCRVSHALLPAFLLARRLDAVEAIGAGLARAVRRRGMRPIAAWLGVPHSTARDWRRRAHARRSGRSHRPVPLWADRRGVEPSPDTGRARLGGPRAGQPRPPASRRLDAHLRPRLDRPLDPSLASPWPDRKSTRLNSSHPSI